MPFKRHLFLIACSAVLALTGCKHTYEAVPMTPAPGPKLSANATAYVAIPPDARRKQDFIINSGLATAQVIQDAFTSRLKRAYIARQSESREEAIATAAKHNCTYLVFPTILKWEDHSTENTGIRDRIELRIEIIDPPTGQLLHGSVIKGRSRFFSDGGDTPKDLLHDPIEKFAASLFQPIYIPSALR
jgi:hypothetical protein